MPNHCSNETTIHGPKAALDDFMARLVPGLGMAGTFHPIPQALKDTPSTICSAEPHPNWLVMLNNGEMTQEWYDLLVKDNAEGYARQQANIAEYGHADWYSWCVKNWGTKWGDYDLIVDRTSDEYIVVRYTTAWAPMLEALQYISDLFPNLTFLTTYDESGMCFCGAAAHYRGEMVAHLTAENDEYPSYNCEDDGDEQDAHDAFMEEVYELLGTMADMAYAGLKRHLVKESEEISN